MVKRKKGISPVITTVLLILLSISAVVIIAGVIIPFIKDSLSGSKECFEVIGQLEIDTESIYTCYDDSNNLVNLTIKRGVKEIDLEGFMIAISGGGTSETFEIEGGEVGNVEMLNGSSDIVIPKRGEERTYSITTTLSTLDYAEIAPIMKSGTTCEPTDKAEIEMCV